MPVYTIGVSRKTNPIYRHMFGLWIAANISLFASFMHTFFRWSLFFPDLINAIITIFKSNRYDIEKHPIYEAYLHFVVLSLSLFRSISLCFRSLAVNVWVWFLIGCHLLWALYDIELIYSHTHTLSVKLELKIIIINNYHYLSFISLCWRLPVLSPLRQQQQQHTLHIHIHTHKHKRENMIIHSPLTCSSQSDRTFERALANKLLYTNNKNKISYRSSRISS